MIYKNGDYEVQDNEKTPGKRRKVTFFRVMVVLLLVFGCVFAIYRFHLRSKLNAKIEAIRAAGHPVTWAELDKWYSIPVDAENAAYTITDAFSCYVKSQDDKLLPLPGRVGLPPRTEPLSEETRVVVVQFITDNKETLELLHVGSAIEHCRYPVDYTAGIETPAPHFQETREAAMLLEIEGILHAENNEPDLAAKSATAALGIARSLSKEPTQISQLVRGACQRYTVSSLVRIINRTEFTDEQLAGLSRTLIEAEGIDGMTRALVGERCVMLTILKMSPTEMSRVLSLLAGLKQSSNFVSKLGAMKLALNKFAGLTDRSLIILLDLFEDYIEASRLPVDDRREIIGKIDVRCREAAKRDSLLARLYIGNLSGIGERNLICIAQLRAARAALAIQRYRLANDRLPDTLDDLVPDYLDAVPIDPFDGEQLRYKKLEVGFVVYSIGEDKDDDGGKERYPAGQKKRQPHECDITFIVER